MRTIYRERIPHSDPRLRRHVLHDSESRRYEHDTHGLTIASVEHVRILPILDQVRVGKCTAEAATGMLGTEPYASDAVSKLFAKAFGSFDDTGTDRLYSAEETIDGDGPFPPRDNGSSGLTSAKACRAAGLISGWTQTFSLDAFLRALTQYPISCGTSWYKSMMATDSAGLVTVTEASGLVGGHQYECVGYSTATGLLKFYNSWGLRWGLGGQFFMQATAFGRLLANRGDATIFTPITQPAPTPTPVPGIPPAGDVALNAELGDWPDAYHLSASAQRVAHALQTWRTGWGF
jgi:hypothetical protein